MDFLPKEIETYALAHTEDESDLLAKLNRETWAKVMTPRMLSGHLQGRVLSMFSKMISPKKKRTSHEESSHEEEAHWRRR